MKGKLIYKEGSSYFGGNNPYDENWNKVIEYKGKYYLLHTWGNYTSSGKKLSVKTNFDPQNIPEEYSRIEKSSSLRGAGREYSLIHGNGEEIDIDLTKFDSEKEMPDELVDEYKSEVKKLVMEKLNSMLDSNPDLDYRSIIANADLTEEEREKAKLITDKIEEELLNDKELNLTDYSKIIENLIPIVKGEVAIITYKSSYYSAPNDSIINLSDMKYCTFASSGLHLDYAWGARATSSDVIPINGKKLPLKDNKTYLGSYMSAGYCVDVIQDEEGKLDLSRNIYESWNNSQNWYPVYNSLPFDRYDIYTGDEGDLAEYNKKVNAIKNEKRQFYRDVVEDLRETYGLRPGEIKQLLKTAGSVKALSLVQNLADTGATSVELEAILRKISYAGVANIAPSIAEALGDNRLDAFQSAAKTLLELDKMLGGTSVREKLYSESCQAQDAEYTAEDIAENINPRIGEINSVMDETINIENSKIETK